MEIFSYCAPMDIFAQCPPFYTFVAVIIRQPDNNIIL